MPWRPLPRIAFAVCIYPFQPSAPADLPLEIGDELYIIEQGGADGSWYRGYLVAPPSLLAGLTSTQGQTLEARVFSGIFPRTCVEVRELLGEANIHGVDSTAGSRAGKRISSGFGFPPGNGALTPSDDAASLNKRRASGAGTGRSSGQKSDKQDGRASRESRKTVVSSPIQQQQVVPLSPVSVPARDPNAPKPIAPVPLLKIGDETPTSAQEPLVDEIASCLREWYSTKLHELLLARKYKSLDVMSALVQRLDTARRQLLHKVLTSRELEELRENIIWDLVIGNKMLSGEVIVRCPLERGRILTADDSPVEIVKLQSVMSSLKTKPPTPQVVSDTLHHLLVDVRSVVGDFTQPATLSVYLCRKAPGEPPAPISEIFAIDVSATDVAKQAAESKMKTLFVDLTSTDIGEGAGSNSILYLVFKVSANEPFRISATAASSSEPRESTSSVQASTPTSNLGSIKGARRSVVWGSRRNKESVPAGKVEEQRPITGTSLKGKIPESRPEPIRTTSGKDTIKRIVGVGVVEVGSTMRQQQQVERDVIMWTPALSPEQQTDNLEGWQTFISELIPSPSGRYMRSTVTNRLHAYVQPFASPDAEALVRQTPTLLHKINPTRKIGFSGTPTRPRSDIYLTLVEPMLPSGALLSHPKNGAVPLGTPVKMANLQLTIEVRRATGERIENCIYPSCNSAGHTAWRTPAVERGESWNSTIRLAVDPEDVPGSHVVMSVADSPNFPFALCWMPLWNQGAFVRDGDYSLALYKYDEYTSSMISGRGAYLALPWALSKKTDLQSEPLAELKLRTFLCSTKYSQDPNLLGILKWRDQEVGELVPLLNRFPFVPEIEIVKLLNEVLDALFGILEEYALSPEYEDLVFHALVMVLGIVYDRRFNLGPLVDQYADTRYNFPLVAPCLLRSYNRLLSNPTDPQIARRLRATFKVGSHVLKFIINARSRRADGDLTPTRQVLGLFRSMETLMRNPAAILVGTKTLIVQHFHNWIAEFRGFLPPFEILDTADSFLGSCNEVQGKLVLYKLILILNVSSLEVFQQPETRTRLVTYTARWLYPYWGKTASANDQYRDQVRLCCSVLASQLNDLGGTEACDYIVKLVDSYHAILPKVQTPKTSLSFLFPSSYPFPSRSTHVEEYFDEALVEISSCLSALFQIPQSLHFRHPNLGGFLSDTLQVFSSVLNCEAFPAHWLSVHIFHHRTTMRSLERISLILIEEFLPHPDQADDFNTELWRLFFCTLLKLVGSDALALETFPEQQRRAVWKIAGDVREMGAELLRSSWEAIGWETSAEERSKYGIERMGGYQVQYVPSLVGPVLELCLSVHEGLRSVGDSVLQTMMLSEWTLSQDLSIIQSEMVDCLDNLFRTKQITESAFQKLFIVELLDAFERMPEMPDPHFFPVVKDLMHGCEELVDLLIAVYERLPPGGQGNGEAFLILDTLNLMGFLQNLGKDDMYIRYVHQLSSLQQIGRRPTEAGLALRLHAKMYDWDLNTTLEALSQPDFPAQTSFERKEQLYFEMIKLFEEGQSWDNALALYAELATQYEQNLFDFSKLARTQRAMGTIYDNIAKGERQQPRYFSVRFRGFGFPRSLQDKHFIFEGSGTDRVATFADKLLSEWPAATTLTSPPEVEDWEGQYLLITPVSVQRDLKHPIYQRTKVSPSVRDYYLLSRPQNFVTSRRQVNHHASKKEGKEGILDHVVEKTVYTTTQPFPTITRRSEVVTTSIIRLSPLEAAIERTTRKTSELLVLEKKAQEGGEDAVMAQLMEALMVSVDSASEVSVARYRALLPVKEPKEEGGLLDDDDDEEEEVQLSPLENALTVALVDHALVVKRCLALLGRPAHQATRADLQARFTQTFAPELTILSPPPARGPSPSLSLLRPQTHISWSAAHSPLPGLAPITTSQGATNNNPINAHPLSLSLPSPLNLSSSPPYTNPASMSISAAAPPEQGQGERGERKTRHEKNRLSLTFFKRQSVRPQGSVSSGTGTGTDDHGPGSGTGRPTLSPDAAMGALDRGVVERKGSRTSVGHTSVDIATGVWAGDSTSQSSTGGGTGAGTGTGTGTGKGGGVMGGMRKRLSALHLGTGMGGGGGGEGDAGVRRKRSDVSGVSLVSGGVVEE